MKTSNLSKIDSLSLFARDLKDGDFVKSGPSKWIEIKKVYPPNELTGQVKVELCNGLHYHMEQYDRFDVKRTKSVGSGLIDAAKEVLGMCEGMDTLSEEWAVALKNLADEIDHAESVNE